MICSACVAEVPDDDAFCENCGAALRPSTEAAAPQAAPCSCGAPESEVDEEGFCGGCGRRVCRPPEDHIECALGPHFAGVSDRGLRHDRNEDRFALVAEANGFAFVVCDGVSSTQRSENASALASESIAASLRGALLAAEEPDAEAALKQAFAQALAALRAEGACGGTAEVPSTTAVAALVRGEKITVGWAGDSRAYWVQGETAEPLTRDHSWLTAALAAGEIPEAEARAAPQAHAITRWLGADADENTEPEIAHFAARAGGALLLCTDGLWNYAPEPDELASLVANLSDRGADALAITRGLVAFANASGGRDNVTASLLQFCPQTNGRAEPSRERLRT